uniref:Uncharacterized protein n=1 Tax=viral metagenome TaxID=1070528 RepID=A0A6C0HCQ1_9ZZZZ
MTTIKTDLNKICDQRKQQMLFNIPPVRYTPISPYEKFPQFTKSQFDMRRKAEILSYTANKSNTKTNNFTKANKWAQLVKGVGQQYNSKSIKLTEVRYENLDNTKYSSIATYTDIIVNYPDTFTKHTDINGNIWYDISSQPIVICNDNMIPTPTSSSDVPGPVINLIRDLNVPLYNYKSSIDTANYGLIPPTENKYINYNIDTNILGQNNTTTSIFSLNINNAIEMSDYFNFEIPLSMYFSGQKTTTSTSYDVSFSNISMTIQTPTISVYYSDSMVGLKNSYDISFNCINNNIISFDLSLNSTTNNFSEFSGEIYIGTLKMKNLFLYTQSGYVYTIKFSNFITDNTSDFTLYSSYFSSLQSGIKFNTTSITKNQTHCEIHQTTSSEPNIGFTLSSANSI